MKNLKIIICTLILGLLFSTTHAQKISVTKGDLSLFKAITVLNVDYDFSEFGVGKFKTEEAYIEDKKTDYNEDEPGKGDKWEEDWHAGKESTYKRKFEELFNLIMLSKKSEMLIGSNPDADYTLILKTTFMEPGYNIGISRKDASINVEAILVKTDDQTNPLVIIKMDKVPGHGLFTGDYDVEHRIGQAYSQAGDKLASYIWKKAMK